MQVARWVAAGVGIGACGGFLAGLLRPRGQDVAPSWLTNGDRAEVALPGSSATLSTTG